MSSVKTVIRGELAPFSLMTISTPSNSGWIWPSRNKPAFPCISINFPGQLSKKERDKQKTRLGLPMKEGPKTEILEASSNEDADGTRILSDCKWPKPLTIDEWPCSTARNVSRYSQQSWLSAAPLPWLSQATGEERSHYCRSEPVWLDLRGPVWKAALDRLPAGQPRPSILSFQTQKRPGFNEPTMLGKAIGSLNIPPAITSGYPVPKRPSHNPDQKT